MGRLNLIILLMAGVSLLPAEALAQPARAPRVTVSATIGGLPAEAVFLRPSTFPRTSPEARGVEARVRRRPPTVGGELRFAWNQRTSTFASFEQSGDVDSRHAYQRPSFLSAAFSAYVAETALVQRIRTWRIGQAFDIRGWQRVYPWIGLALDRRTVTERERTVSIGFNDPLVRLQSDRSWARRQTLLIPMAGARWQAARRLVFSTAAGATILGKEACGCATRNRVELRGSPFANAAVGIGF